MLRDFVGGFKQGFSRAFGLSQRGPRSWGLKGLFWGGVASRAGVQVLRFLDFGI